MSQWFHLVFWMIFFGVSGAIAQENPDQIYEPPPAPPMEELPPPAEYRDESDPSFAQPPPPPPIQPPTDASQQVAPVPGAPTEPTQDPRVFDTTRITDKDIPATPPGQPAQQPFSQPTGKSPIIRGDLSRDDERYDPRVPRFEQQHPRFGLEVRGHPVAFRRTNAADFGIPFSMFEVQFDYQPDLIQPLGIVGIGVQGTVYPILGDDVVTRQFFAAYAGGGHIRYQARFFDRQILVPMVSAELSYLHYDFDPDFKSVSGSFLTQAVSAGAWVLLNFFDPWSAASFNADYAVLRSYAVAEIRQITGSDADLDVEDTRIFFGIRVEF